MARKEWDDGKEGQLRETKTKRLLVRKEGLGVDGREGRAK